MDYVFENSKGGSRNHDKLASELPIIIGVIEELASHADSSLNFVAAGIGATLIDDDGFLATRGYNSLRHQISQVALHAAKRGTDAHLLSLSMYNFGSALIGLSRMVDAAAALSQTLAFIDSSGCGEELLGIESGTHLALGNLALRDRNFTVAASHFRESLSISQSTGNASGIAAASGQLGAIALEQRKISEAKELYELALTNYEAIGYERGQAAAIHQLGTIAAGVGSMANAHTLFWRSLRLEQQIGNFTGVSVSARDILRVSQDITHDANSIQGIFEEFLETYSESENREGTADVLQELGRLALIGDNYEVAFEYIQRSYEIKAGFSDDLGMAVSLGNLSQIEFERGNLEASKNYAQASLEKYEAVNLRRGAATSYFDLGRIAQAEGKTQSARIYYQQSVALYAQEGSPDVIQPMVALQLLEDEPS